MQDLYHQQYFYVFMGASRFWVFSGFFGLLGSLVFGFFFWVSDFRFLEFWEGFVRNWGVVIFVLLEANPEP